MSDSVDYLAVAKNAAGISASFFSAWTRTTTGVDAPGVFKVYAIYGGHEELMAAIASAAAAMEHYRIVYGLKAQWGDQLPHENVCWDKIAAILIGRQKPGASPAQLARLALDDVLGAHGVCRNQSNRGFFSYPEGLMATVIDKSIATTINREIDQAVKAIAEKHGLKSRPSRATFSATNISYRGELTAEGAEQVEFARYAPLFGLKADDFGKPFTTAGTAYTISGIKPGSAKYPVLAKRSDGKVFKFPADRVVDALARGA